MTCFLLTLARHHFPRKRYHVSEIREETTQRFAELAEAQRQVGEQLSRRVEWQRGEAGRRDGDRYERNTSRRAITLFAGEEGGSADQPYVQKVLYRWLKPLYEDNGLFDAARDPSLAEIIWWNRR